MTDIKYLPCVSRDYCDELKQALDSTDIDAVYGGDAIKFESARLLRTPIVRVGPCPNLLEPDGQTAPQHDAKSAIYLHKHLPEMTSAQGADERVWAYLTHTEFHAYTKARFGFKGGTNQVRHIRNRWFKRGGRQGLLGNAVARLWWAAHLTYAPWEGDAYFAPLQKVHTDNYIYTRWLFGHQNMFQGLVARRFGGSLRVRICMLEAFERRAKVHSNLSALSEEVERRLNLVCSYRVLSALPFDVLMAVMEDHVARATSSIHLRRDSAQPGA